MQWLILAYLEDPIRQKALQEGFSSGKYLLAIVRDEPLHCPYTKRCA